VEKKKKIASQKKGGKKGEKISTYEEDFIEPRAENLLKKVMS